MSDSEQPMADNTSPQEESAIDEPKTSVPRVMIGLAVIWASLYLVAIAQKISFEESNGAGSANTKAGIAEGGTDAPGEQLDELTIQLYSKIQNLEVQAIPAKQIVKKLLYDGHLFAEPGALDKVPPYPISLSLEDVPLYSALGQAVAAADMGFYIREDRIGFFDRIVSHEQTKDGEPILLKWETDIRLTPEWTTIYASEDSDIRIDLKAHPLEPAGDTQSRRIEYEIRENLELIGSGMKSLLVSASEPVTIQPVPETILRIGNSPFDVDEGVLSLTFIYRAIEPAQDES